MKAFFIDKKVLLGQFSEFLGCILHPARLTKH